jgi:hypothetical protein
MRTVLPAVQLFGLSLVVFCSSISTLGGASKPTNLQTPLYPFDPSGSTYTFPSSINPSGAVTGSYYDSNNAYHGFVRNPQGQITPFDPSGSTDTEASSINPSGVRRICAMEAFHSLRSGSSNYRSGKSYPDGGECWHIGFQATYLGRHGGQDQGWERSLEGYPQGAP